MGRSIDFYISNGFTPQMAAYFASGRKQITGVVPNDNFTLTICFDNGERRIYDVAPLLKPKTVFEPFMDLANFRRVYVDDTHSIAWDIDPAVDSSVVWSNKVDLCPDSCYVDSVPITEGDANV